MSNCTDVEHALEKHGVLLLQDKTALSVVGLLTGEKLSGSWWGHAQGQTIFSCLERLDEHSDVIATRLVAAKITYVHRRLWPGLLAVALSQSAWQTNGLSVEARSLLDVVRHEATRASGRAARDLQERLLVHAEQVHTESGRHETLLEEWSRVQKMRDAVPNPDIEAAREEIEGFVAGIGASAASLPWHRL